MSYATLYALMVARLQTVSGLPTLQLENTSNIGTTGTPFARATLLPARPRQLTVGQDGKDLLLALFQVDLFYPLNSGVSASQTLADTIVAAFPRTLILSSSGTTVHIRTAWAEAGGRVEQFYNTRVLVEVQVVR